MDRFLREYNGHIFEDNGCVCSKDFKSFANKFKNFLKRTLPGCEIIGHRCNHYDFSGFLKHGDNFIYYSYSWDRRSPVDIYNSYNCLHSILIRFASSEKDYRGEHNNFTSFVEFPNTVAKMFLQRCPVAY